MTKSYQEFKNMVLGKAFDVDGWYSAQCWDGYAYYMQYLGYTPAWCTSTGYVQDIYTNMDSNGMKSQCDLVYNLQAGDIVVFPRNSVTPLSHVAIFDSDAGNGYGNFLGQNQTSADASGSAFSIARLPYSATYYYAFRPKIYAQQEAQAKAEAEAKAKAEEEAKKKAEEEAKNSQTPEKVKDETATFESTVDGLGIRDFPSTRADLSNRVGELDKGDRVTYDSVYNCDNKRWVSYIAYSGNRRYVCIRDYTTGDIYGKAY